MKIDNINWEAISAIGTCLGALATFVACVIALWQTKIAYKKKLKVVFNDNITFINPLLLKNNEKFVGISIYNKGNRNVIINEWSFEFKNHMRGPILVNFTKYYPTKFPICIEVENNKDVFYERAFFEQNVQDLINKGQISKNKKIRFSIKDATGKKYFFYSPKKAKEYVEQENG